jgi:uncharacterized HAD superfamily protein
MSRNLPTVVISDLDSTLCNTAHRHELANECLMTGNWDEYSKQCLDDEPIIGSITTLRLLYPYHRIHLCTGRSIVARDNTEKWLADFEVPYDELIMFDKSRWETKPSNGLLKAQYIQDLRSRGYQVVLFLEDWHETAEAIEAVGVPVMCVNPRYSKPLTTHL